VAYVSYPLAGIRDAEEALRLYLHLSNGGGQARSLDLYDTREACDRCGGGPRTTRGRRGREVEVCASCAFPWKGRTVPLLEPRASRTSQSGETVKPRKKRSSPRVRREETTPVEHAAEVLVLLRRVIEPRPRDSTAAEWRFDLRAFAVWTDGKGCSYARAAELGAEIFPTYESESRWWSEWKVREACTLAREVIERRLRRGWAEWRDEGSRRGRRPGASASSRAAFVA
jgi:hypothetical protein